MIRETQSVPDAAREIPSPHDTQRPVFFNDPGIDHLFAMTMELAAELWVQRERLFAIECVAQAHGIDLTKGVEKWSPSPDQAHVLADMREQLMRRMFRTVDQAAPDA